MMNQDSLRSHRRIHSMHSIALLTAMMALPAWLGHLLLGASGLVLASVAILALFTVGRISPHWVLRMQRARPLAPSEAPGLHRLLNELTKRAELHAVPQLYLVPSPMLNAFATGHSAESAIGLTRGLLTRLDRRQLAGVLAHEISHIRHRDLWIMGIAQLLSQMTRSLSFLGQVIFLLLTPAWLLGGGQLPWAAMILALVAPSASALLLLALSRTREFEADFGAARLTGDPLGLASALEQLEAQAADWWRLFFPLPRRRASSPLDSHPATSERIARLRSLIDRPIPQRPQIRQCPQIRQRPQILQRPQTWGAKIRPVVARPSSVSRSGFGFPRWHVAPARRVRRPIALTYRLASY